MKRCRRPGSSRSASFAFHTCWRPHFEVIGRTQVPKVHISLTIREFPALCEEPMPETRPEAILVQAAEYSSSEAAVLSAVRPLTVGNLIPRSSSPVPMNLPIHYIVRTSVLETEIQQIELDDPARKNILQMSEMSLSEEGKSCPQVHPFRHILTFSQIESVSEGFIC